MPQSLSLADRLLAPATNLMGRLRFNQKAMLIGAAFTLTCGVLAGLVVTRSLGEISDARTARSATVGLDMLHDAQLAMQDHRQLRARKLANDPTATDQGITDAAARADKALTNFDAWRSNAGFDNRDLVESMKATGTAWKKAVATEGEAGPDADSAALEALRVEIGKIAFTAITAVANDTAMLRGGEIGGILLPELASASAKQAVVGIRVLGEGAIWVSDRTELAVRKNMQGYLSGQIGDGRKYIEKELPEGAALFGKPMSAALQAMEAQNKMIQEQILDAETPESPVAGLARQDQATRIAMNKAMKATSAAINAAGDRSIASLQLKAFATLGFVALALLAAAYLFMGFTRGTRKALQTIESGARSLAAGQFSERIHVATRDELNDIGRGMEDAAAALRKFAQAQQVLFDEQKAGDLDSRIDAENFPGAFGVMAEQVNALVASFIDENLHIIDVIGDYGRGDLSRDVNRMPGKKAEAIKSVDAVKASLLAVNSEIKTLVDAAVAGDFSKRGDASRFDFVYRELVERLDQLMATSQNGLTEVGTLLSAVADGDLTRRIEVQLPGQFGQLAGDANRTVEGLAQIVGNIRQTSDGISAASGEIAAGNSDLSMRTEQQAASLEETASSMEELTSTVKQNADNARQANQLAQGAAGVAAQGGEVVQQVVATMSAIEASSKKIADIISVIDGIAFQTNILALNAAVEAARAGEQGRGFAVVAGEVRALAQRSAGAAKEIKQLIEESVGKVTDGSALVRQAGNTMGEIVSSVQRVTDIIADISAASQEQSSGIEQVNQAITQMDEGTQQNAALVEQASASAESMRQQATQLVEAVSAFRTAAAAAAPARAVATPAAPRAAAAPPAAAPVRRQSTTARKTGAAAAPAPTPLRSRAPATAGSGGDQHWQEF
ncbi:methyl-accepting chemotaxis protein [Thermomonas fusca]|nr:methyl-accepting chemotaxis protein [Thermomonas fusca]